MVVTCFSLTGCLTNTNASHILTFWTVHTHRTYFQCWEEKKKHKIEREGSFRNSTICNTCFRLPEPIHATGELLTLKRNSARSLKKKKKLFTCTKFLYCLNSNLHLTLHFLVGVTQPPFLSLNPFTIVNSPPRYADIQVDIRVSTFKRDALFFLACEQWMV